MVVLRNTIKLSLKQAEELKELDKKSNLLSSYFGWRTAVNEDRTLWFHEDAAFPKCIEVLTKYKDFFLKHKINGEVVFLFLDDRSVVGYVLEHGVLYSANVELT